LSKSAPPPGRRRERDTQQPTLAASTRSMLARLQRRCGYPRVRLRLVEVSASAWAEARVGYATAHSDHALRKVTSPFVPMPSSARMAAPRYAVKALLARSVLACGCAPHAACDRVHDRARRSATPASRRRVHGDGSAPACALLLCVCSTQQQPQPQLRGACSCPAPDPRTRDSGNPAPLSNRNILFPVNSMLW
jgi:hypothetical protein